MKMRVLGCQPRRRKDPWNSAYSRGKKIRAGTDSQDLPPAIVADCLQHRCNTVVERSAGPWHFIFCSTALIDCVDLNRSKFLAILRGCVSRTECGFVLDGSVFGPATCFSPIFLAAPFGDRVQSFDAGVEMRSPGQRDRVLRLIQTEKRPGFCSPMTSMERGTENARRNEERGRRW
jgi:hypothetical protein